MSDLEHLLKEKTFCFILLQKVQNYYKDPEHRKQFEEWYRKKYGKEYEWK